MEGRKGCRAPGLVVRIVRRSWRPPVSPRARHPSSKGVSPVPYDVIVPKGSAPPLAPYSPGTRAGNAVYVSGTLALDSNGNLVGKDDIKAQTRQVLETIKSVLEAAGGSMKDIAFNHIFLSDLGGYAAMNEVYREYFPENPPARYCIRADLVKPEFLVEIASIAHLDT
jgi:aminoacrylate peracid reductase